MKTINNYIVEKINKSNLKKVAECTLFPKNRKELVKMIKEEISTNGNECSLNHIDVSKITNMDHVFSSVYDLHEFNGDISQWDVSKVKSMRKMFYYSKFNQDIGNWDVSNVTDMYCMFTHSKFNQPLKYWDISNVDDMSHMFGDSDFNQDISNWKLNSKCNVPAIFYNCNINREYKPKLPN